MNPATYTKEKGKFFLAKLKEVNKHKSKIEKGQLNLAVRNHLQIQSPNQELCLFFRKFEILCLPSKCLNYTNSDKAKFNLEMNHSSHLAVFKDSFKFQQY